MQHEVVGDEGVGDGLDVLDLDLPLHELGEDLREEARLVPDVYNSLRSDQKHPILPLIHLVHLQTQP